MRNLRKEKRRVDTRTVALFILRTALACALVAAWAIAAEAQTKEEVKQIIIEEAEKYGLDSTLLLSLARVESSFNPRARGTIGERGLFQLRPEYFGTDASDCPRRNTATAAKFLLWHKQRPACAKFGRYFYLCHNIGATRARKLSLTEARNHPYTKKVEAARKDFLRERSVAGQ